LAGWTAFVFTHTIIITTTTTGLHRIRGSVSSSLHFPSTQNLKLDDRKRTDGRTGSIFFSSFSSSTSASTAIYSFLSHAWLATLHYNFYIADDDHHQSVSSVKFYPLVYKRPFLLAAIVYLHTHTHTHTTNPALVWGWVGLVWLARFWPGGLGGWGNIEWMNRGCDTVSFFFYQGTYLLGHT
jgi:hypothetical protein